jgi:inner membrane protein
MDNLCHTLVGAALGRAGLGRRSRFGTATLMIASNLPDIDVLVFATGMPAVAFRRGWTHGVLAQAVLPIALTAVMAVVASRRAPANGDKGAQAPLHVPWLLLLSIIGIYSHVLLDYLNNYGLRLLSPIDWRWFYGDSLFIIDPWLWLTLGAGVWLARRTRRRTPAIAALLCASIYIGVMVASSRTSRARVVEDWTRRHGSPPAALMVGPQPVTPFRRSVIIDAGDHYRAGTIAWPSGDIALDDERVPKNESAADVQRAREARDVRGFLVWSRFPFWTVEDTAAGRLVTVRDMRFGERFSSSVIVEAE